MTVLVHPKEQESDGAADYTVQPNDPFHPHESRRRDIHLRKGWPPPGRCPVTALRHGTREVAL